MQIGMLWYNADPKTTLDVKIQEAAEYYTAKYGRSPDSCYVNPGALLEKSSMSGKITVHPLRSVMPNHLWIGVESLVVKKEDAHIDAGWKE
jgi:hypothetical protein